MRVLANGFIMVLEPLWMRLVPLKGGWEGCPCTIVVPCCALRWKDNVLYRPEDDPHYMLSTVTSILKLAASRTLGESVYCLWETKFIVFYYIQSICVFASQKPVRCDACQFRIWKPTLQFYFPLSSTLTNQNGLTFHFFRLHHQGTMVLLTFPAA